MRVEPGHLRVTAYKSPTYKNSVDTPLVREVESLGHVGVRSIMPTHYQKTEIEVITEWESAPTFTSDATPM